MSGGGEHYADGMEPFVVSINADAQRDYRSFWTGPVGTVALIVPGVILAVVGFVLGFGWADSGATMFFAGVIVFSGFYASYAGWDHRRKAAREFQEDPWAFVIADDGVMFPRHKHYPWSEARFVLTHEDRPRLLCTPVGLAYAVEQLDRRPEEIADAVAEASGGLVGMERATR